MALSFRTVIIPLAVLAALAGLVAVPSTALTARGEPVNDGDGDPVYILMIDEESKRSGPICGVKQDAPGKSGRRDFQRALKGYVASFDRAHRGGGRSGSSDADIEDCLERNVRSGRILAWERDTQSETSDWLDPAPWGLDRMDQRSLPLDGAHGRDSAGAGSRVYVIDTGVRGDHEQLAGRVDGGWSALDGGPGSVDCNGHGTHVAGSIAGRTLGVSPAARIVPVRALGCSGAGPVSNIIAALDWVLFDHETKDHAAVVNLSLSAFKSRSLNAAVARVVTSGLPVVVAAGNEGVDACERSPSSEPSAVTVGSVGRSDARSSFSNVGSCIDIFAPGEDVESAISGSSTGSSFKSGTSMASAYVAGAMARLVAPALGPTLPGDALLAMATPGIAGRLLYTQPSSAPRPQREAAPGELPSEAQQSLADAGIAPPRIVRARYTARRVILWLFYEGTSPIEVLRNGRVVKTTLTRKVSLRAGTGRREVLRVRAAGSGVASVAPGASNRVVRVRNRVRVLPD